MRPVLCFGEALIDFLNTGQTEQGPLTLPSFRQYPGGAPANAAVAVAKLGGRALFAGQVGNDVFGHFLADALRAYGVNTDFLVHHATAKTALAFVMLDPDGDRRFSFHRDDSADVIFQQGQVLQTWFADQPIIHICSNTLTSKQIANCTRYIIEQTHQHQATVSFDVNLRHNLWATGKADIPLVNELVWQSDIVKFSKDELDYLSENRQKAYLQYCLTRQCQLIVITDGAYRIEYFTKTDCGGISPTTVKAVDTTAGGDAFVGGLLYALSHQPLKQVLSSLTDLSAILHFAAACGAHAVTQQGAFPALPTLDVVLNQLSANHHDSNRIQQLINE